MQRGSLQRRVGNEDLWLIDGGDGYAGPAQRARAAVVNE